MKFEEYFSFEAIVGDLIRWRVKGKGTVDENGRRDVEKVLPPRKAWSRAGAMARKGVDPEVVRKQAIRRTVMRECGGADAQKCVPPMQRCAHNLMQLVDKVIETGDNYIVGVKNVTSNEPFFQGHFPQEPVMPGVLQIEAMAQVGGLLVLSGVDEPERYSTYFLKIDNVKFRQKVVPGDTLLFHVSFMTPMRRGCAVMKGYAFVGEKIVSEVEFMAQIIKNK